MEFTCSERLFGVIFSLATYNMQLITVHTTDNYIAII